MKYIFNLACKLQQTFKNARFKHKNKIITGNMSDFNFAFFRRALDLKIVKPNSA